MCPEAAIFWQSFVSGRVWEILASHPTLSIIVPPFFYSHRSPIPSVSVSPIFLSDKSFSAAPTCRLKGTLKWRGGGGCEWYHSIGL
jgi:hypothetical protein